jgi:hypothetical protein
MEHTAILPLAVWESFYVIMGSSAAALTGLQFVVIVLAAETNALGRGHSVRAFGTPTIVHFCAVLLISAILSAPWRTLSTPATVLAGFGVGGVAYVVMSIRNAHRQTDYKPVTEDWIWYGVLPLIAYVVLLAAAIALRQSPVSLFAIGATALGLLFIGIHNAWDSVTYIAIELRQEMNTQKSDDPE